MFRALLPVLTLVLLLMAAPAHAIPCPSGSLADYIALGSDGCNFMGDSPRGPVGLGLSVSNFSYHGTPATASEVSVVPSTHGAAFSHRLTFSASPGWTFFEIGFDAGRGSSILGDQLALRGVTFTGPQQEALVVASAAPGGLLLVCQASTAFLCPVGSFANLNVPNFSPGFANQTITIEGLTVNGATIDDFSFNVITPEPTTLLLWGTTAAGFGLVRWRKRCTSSRQSANHVR